MLKIPEVPERRARKTIVLDAQRVEIPQWIGNLASFRLWAKSDEFPESGRNCYLNDELWVDMSKEQVFTHNQVKSTFTSVLFPLVKAEKLGRYFSDGVLISNETANLSAQPDGSFVGYASLKAGRLQLVPDAQDGFVELEGTPDRSGTRSSPTRRYASGTLGATNTAGKTPAAPRRGTAHTGFGWGSDNHEIRE